MDIFVFIKNIEYMKNQNSSFTFLFCLLIFLFIFYLFFLIFLLIIQCKIFFIYHINYSPILIYPQTIYNQPSNPKMFREKVSLNDKLQFITKPILQNCQLHNNQSKFYCSKPSCMLYSYLCDKCKRQNSHGHQDQIFEFQTWIEKMIGKITELGSGSMNRIMQTQYNKNKNDFNSYLTELKRILSIVEGIQSKLLQAIRQSKYKILTSIRKYQNYKQSKLPKLINLYTNPYLFINKINSQKNDVFIQQIKRLIKGESIDDIDTFNSKKEVIVLQNRLKGILNGNNQQIFSSVRQKIKVPDLEILENSVFYCESKPEQVFLKNEMLMIGYRSQTQLFNVNTLTMNTRLGISLYKCSSLVIDNTNQFIGINKSNNKELITYINNKLGSFVFQYKLSSILLYYNVKYYAFLGREEGKIIIFDITKSQILANLQESHNMKVEFMEYWQNQMKILTCGINTAVSIYKIQHLSNQVSLVFEEQFDFETKNIEQFIVHGTFMIIFSKNRSITAYDIILRQMYKTNPSEQCKEFDFTSVIFQNQNNLLLLSHNKDENQINSWLIEKSIPDDIKRNKISFFGGSAIQVLELNKRNLWVMRHNDAEHKLYNFNIVMM